MSTAKDEELTRLKDCRERMHAALRVIDSRLRDYAGEIQTRKDYLWDARRDMDHIEKIAVRHTIEQTLDAAEVLKAQQQKIHRLMRSPYFGRFDFRRDEAKVGGAVYVGVHHFRDEEAGETLVYDWRAPIASMFYDHEIGPASYQAPSGEISGELTLKRQFRIRDGEMEFMFETGLHIVDDVLQQELSRAADEGMKNIVATIQRDQNAIVRNEEAHTLIIQGVAGSGKTSIALHRIAYLLYRFRETLSSDDILILSPNKVFADYIGNVLPELGEEQVNEIGMEDLAEELLDAQYRFETFFEQTARLLESNDEALRERIQAKASADFLRQIERYASELESRSFVAREWRVGRKIVPDWFFAETWPKSRGQGITERVQRLLKATEQQLGFHYNYDLAPEEKRSLREAIKGMVHQSTLREAYKGLFDWLGRPELFKPAGGKLEYADVFPLIYLKMLTDGVKNPRRGIKHLLIDEMQDYSPVQYAVLGKLFNCRKTVLGDISQSVNPYSASHAEAIGQALKNYSTVRLNKSYRCTWEIMQFALAVAPNPDLEAMHRPGEPPRVYQVKSAAKALDTLLGELADFENSSQHSLAIITKTQKQAQRLYLSLEKTGVEVRLLDAGSVGFSTGVLVCTAHMAKGLEFDRVIVHDVSAKHYHSEMDRNLLYVACTRAMHRLSVISIGAPSPLLPAGYEADASQLTNTMAKKRAVSQPEQPPQGPASVSTTEQTPLPKEASGTTNDSPAPVSQPAAPEPTPDKPTSTAGREDLDIEHFRSKLLAEKQKIHTMEGTRKDSSATVELDQAAVGRLSRMDALQQQAMAQNTRQRSEQALLRIEAALRRCDSGDYGYCLECDEAINPRRLELDPASTLCIRCASKRDA